MSYTENGRQQMEDWCQNKEYVRNIQLACGRKWEAGREAHATDPNTWETEGGLSPALSLRPA